MSKIDRKEARKEFSSPINEPELSISLPNYFNKPGNINEQYFIGRKDELDKLVNLLERGQGGSYLVSGYRGVGKTRFVNQALQEYKDSKNKNNEVVPQNWTGC